MNHNRVANYEAGWIKWGTLGVILSLSSQVVAQENTNQPRTTRAEADAGANPNARTDAGAGVQAETGAGTDQRGTANGDGNDRVDGDGKRDGEGALEPQVSDNSDARPEPPGGTTQGDDMSNPTVEKSAGMGSDVAYADKGVVELGGTIGLDIRDELFTLRIAPSVGYFIADRFELTLVPIITVVHASDNDAASETTVAVSVVVEPSYHLPFTDSLYGFAGVGLGLTFEEGPGADFLLRPVLGLDVLIGRSGILKPYGFMDVGVGNGAVGGGFMAGYTIMF